MAQPAHDPSRHSYYVDDALYRELIADFEIVRRDDPTVQDLAERDLFRGLLEREATTSTTWLIFCSALPRKPHCNRAQANIDSATTRLIFLRRTTGASQKILPSILDCAMNT